MIRIFADECIPFGIITALRQRALAVTSVRDVGLVGSSDEYNFAYAQQHGMVILTFDRGFGDIFRFRIRKSFGVVIALVSQLTPGEIVDIVSSFVSYIRDDEMDGKLVIIGKNKIRVIQP